MEIRAIPRLFLATALLAAASAAAAQNLDALKSKAGGLLGSGSSSGASSSGSLLGSLGSGSVGLGSAKNVAGVLGYCEKQGYIKGPQEAVKDKLLSKIGGQSSADQDSGYKQGLSGTLQGSDGKSYDLSALKGKVGKKVCGKVADKAGASFLAE